MTIKRNKNYTLVAVGGAKFHLPAPQTGTTRERGGGKGQEAIRDKDRPVAAVVVVAGRVYTTNGLPDSIGWPVHLHFLILM